MDLEETGTLGFAPSPTPKGAIGSGVNPADHDLAQLALTANCARQAAAYRRLALTILGFDVPSLIQTLPTSRGSSLPATVRADQDRSCGTPRLASTVATRPASDWR